MNEGDDTIFAKIIRREIPADIVYEDADTLVIPKKPTRNFLEMDQPTLDAFMRSIQKVAKMVLAATKADGVNIGINTEAAAGQVIFHTHAHIIPRFKEDGLGDWRRRHEYTAEESKAIAEKIRAVAQ